MEAQDDRYSLSGNISLVKLKITIEKVWTHW